MLCLTQDWTNSVRRTAFRNQGNWCVIDCTMLSETVRLVTKALQRTPSSWGWHLMSKACSFIPSSLSSVQVSEPYNRTGRTHVL